MIAFTSGAISAMGLLDKFRLTVSFNNGRSLSSSIDTIRFAMPSSTVMRGEKSTTSWRGVSLSNRFQKGVLGSSFKLRHRNRALSGPIRMHEQSTGQSGDAEQEKSSGDADVSVREFGGGNVDVGGPNFSESTRHWRSEMISAECLAWQSMTLWKC